MSDFSEDESIRTTSISSDLDEYDILSTINMSAAVPSNSDLEFRKFIWAAMATYAFGNKSIDNVMKRYDYAWQEWKKGAYERDPFILSLRGMFRIINKVSYDLEKTKVENSLSSICAKAALCRLEASFKAAYGLVRKEYIFETDAVAKVILEQLAWAYSAKGLNEEDLLKLKPNKCITKFKEFFPESGTFYGQINRWAHLDPFIVKQYEKFHNEEVSVVRRNHQNSRESGGTIIMLSLVYLNLVQALFSVYKKDDFKKIFDELTSFRNSYEKDLKSDL